MNKKIFKIINLKLGLVLTLAVVALESCVPTREIRVANTSLPENFKSVAGNDTVNVANINWKQFFRDSNLITLIDTALVNNQELNIMLQHCR